MDLSFLQALNENPLAGAMLIVMLLLVQQIVRLWRGRTDVTRIESENNKLAKQTSETVNLCAARTKEAMDKLEEFIQSHDVRHLSTKLNTTVQMLAAMAHDQDLHNGTLDRVVELCHDIDRDVRSADHRIAHTQIHSKLEAVEKLVEDVKRIAITLSK